MLITILMCKLSASVLVYIAGYGVLFQWLEYSYLGGLINSSKIV